MSQKAVHVFLLTRVCVANPYIFPIAPWEDHQNYGRMCLASIFLDHIFWINRGIHSIKQPLIEQTHLPDWQTALVVKHHTRINLNRSVNRLCGKTAVVLTLIPIARQWHLRSYALEFRAVSDSIQPSYLCQGALSLRDAKLADSKETNGSLTSPPICHPHIFNSLRPSDAYMLR